MPLDYCADFLRRELMPSLPCPSWLSLRASRRPAWRVDGLDGIGGRRVVRYRCLQHLLKKKNKENVTNIIHSHSHYHSHYHYARGRGLDSRPDRWHQRESVV